MKQKEGYIEGGSMQELRVIVAENGFVIDESQGSYLMGKMWAFETPDSLAKYMKEWGKMQVELKKPIKATKKGAS